MVANEALRVQSYNLNKDQWVNVSSEGYEGNPLKRYRAECNLSIAELEPETSFQTIVWNKARDLQVNSPALTP